MSEQEGAAPLLPPRRRHWRKDETEHASLVQSFAGLKGLVYGTVLGGLGCYFAGIAYPKFGQQRLQVKVFLTASGMLTPSQQRYCRCCDGVEMADDV